MIGWNLHPEILSRLAATATEPGLPLEPVDLHRLGAQADVIITITSRFDPILRAQVSPAPTSPAWAPTPRASRRSRPRSRKGHRLHDEVAQSVTIGEAQHAVGFGLIAESRPPRSARSSPAPTPAAARADEITLFDGTGVGLQDLAVAAAALTWPAGRHGDRDRRLTAAASRSRARLLTAPLSPSAPRPAPMPWPTSPARS